MNITRQDLGDLTASLQLDIQESDYSERVKKILKDYQKKAQMPGFRQGNVPFGVIQKMYGKAVLGDEIFKMIDEMIGNYLMENKVEILGSPLSDEEKTGVIDWDKQKDFTFHFTIALQPEIKLDLKKTKATLYEVEPDDAKVDEMVKNYQRRFGEISDPEVAGEKDMVYGTITELDDAGQPKAEGIKTFTSINIDTIAQKTIQKKFIGAKKEDVIVFNIAKAFKTTEEIAQHLRIDREKAETLKSDFSLEITGISHVEELPVDKDLFAKAFPKDKIKNETEFRNKIKETIVIEYQRTIDYKFLDEASQALIKKANLTLPDEFLKRWLKETNKELTVEQIENDYPKYRDSMVWQLIENKIIRDNEISVKKEDVKNYLKEFVIPNYFPVEEGNEEQEQQADMFAESMMKSEKDVKQIYDYLYDKALTDMLKQQVAVTAEKVSIEEFTKILEKKK